MKPWVLICIGLVWLGAVLLFLVFVRTGFGFYVSDGSSAQMKLDILSFFGFFLLLGWLIPLSIAVLRLVRRSR